MAIKAPTVTDLDSTQRDVVRFEPYDSPMFVSGPPGSGKTHVAILRLQVLINNGFSNVLFLLFNHSMYGFLRTIFDKMNIRRNVLIETKDIFLINIARSLGYDPSLKHYDVGYDLTLDFLLNNNLNRRYDVIVIDECQDFSEKEVKILNKMSSKIIAVGDMDQKIYNNRSHSLFESLPNRKLSTIYRFGKKIASLAENFAESSESLTDKVSISTSTEAYKVAANNNYDAAEKIARIVNSKQHTNQSIAILVPSTSQIKELKQNLEEHDVETFTAKSNRDFRSYDFNENKPLLLTPHSAKGMEFDVVILYGYNEDKISWQSRRENLLYVSITRTSDELYLISQPNTYSILNNLDGWIEMSTSSTRRANRLTDGF